MFQSIFYLLIYIYERAYLSEHGVIYFLKHLSFLIQMGFIMVNWNKSVNWLQQFKPQCQVRVTFYDNQAQEYDRSHLDSHRFATASNKTINRVMRLQPTAIQQVSAFHSVIHK